MFVGCSEINISLELSGLFFYLGGLKVFQCLMEQKKIAGLWFAKGGQYPGWHHALMYMWSFMSFNKLIGKV